MQKSFIFEQKWRDFMTVRDVKETLGARIACGEQWLDREVHSACGSDMMSDVLAFVKDHSLLLTGLVNTQVVRTAEMMDMRCIAFVRGKEPSEEIIELANDSGIVLMKTNYRMYTACGILYAAGLRSEGCDQV